MKYIALVLLYLVIFLKINGQDCNKEDTYTPPKGSNERKDILDVLREEVYKMHTIEVIFIVKYLKVYNGWAWLHVQPQSIDEKEHYEDLLALMHNNGNKWEVVEIPCVEEDNPDCITSESYYSGLIQRFPEIPRCILPTY
jgi:hypothetical protein